MADSDQVAYDGTRAAHGRIWRVAVLLALFLVASGTLLASGRSVTARLDLVADERMVAAVLLVLAVTIIAKPLRASCLLFVILPFFGNHPGGRFMEALTFLLAASLLGLAVHAWRRGLPLPKGALWWLAAAYVASAALAFIATVPWLTRRWREINDPLGFFVHALSSNEGDYLYALQSLVLVVLTVGWAAVFRSCLPDVALVTSVLRHAAFGFAIVIVLGILDWHGALDLRTRYMAAIDPHGLTPQGFQSVFWNTGWFAFYFTLAFGLAVPLVWTERSYHRWAVIGLLAVAYVHFLFNPQRAGVLALHGAFAIGALGALRRYRLARRDLRIAGAVLLTMAVAMAVSGLRHGGDSSFLGLRRLVRDPGDSVRYYLAIAAWEMWQSAPVFGIGEGSFLWRYHDFIPQGSSRAVITWTDAHNTWLQFLATRGLVGFLTFLATILLLARRIASLYRSGGRRPLAIGFSMALTSFVIYSFFQYMFYLQSINLLFWGLVALSDAAAPPDRAHLLRPAGGGGRRLLRSFALVLVALIGWQLASVQPAWRRSIDKLKHEPLGFSKIETSPSGAMRWSSSRGVLCIYPSAPIVQLGVVVPHPDVRTRPLTITVRADGRLIDQFEPERRGIYTRSYYLPSAAERPRSSTPRFGECLEASGPLRLGVEVDRLWSPMSAEKLNDPRYLGIGVLEPRYSSAGPDVDLGLFGPENLEGQVIRWTGAAGSLSVNLPSDRAVIRIPMRAINPDLERRPVGVRVYWKGLAMGSAVLSRRAWETMQFTVEDATRSGIVTIEVDHVWQPRAARRGPDGRFLGVQMGGVDVQPAGE